MAETIFPKEAISKMLLSVREETLIDEGCVGLTLEFENIEIKIWGVPDESLACEGKVVLSLDKEKED